MSESLGGGYRCGGAARWLPRALAGSVLAAGMLAGARIEARGGVPGSASFRVLLVLAAAATALWIVRKGGEVRVQARPDAEGLVLTTGNRRARVAFDDLEAVRYEGAFGPSRSWLPAAVLVDRFGSGWRLSALLDDGARLIDEIVERSGREDLAAWVAAHRVRARMARAVLLVRAGYSVAAGVLAVGVLYYLT